MPMPKIDLSLVPAKTGSGGINALNNHMQFVSPFLTHKGN